MKKFEIGDWVMTPGGIGKVVDVVREEGRAICLIVDVPTELFTTNKIVFDVSRCLLVYPSFTRKEEKTMDIQPQEIIKKMISKVENELEKSNLSAHEVVELCQLLIDLLEESRLYKKIG